MTEGVPSFSGQVLTDEYMCYLHQYHIGRIQIQVTPTEFPIPDPTCPPGVEGDVWIPGCDIHIGDWKAWQPIARLWKRYADFLDYCT